ncbi:MAG: phosphonate C-P lyase system protein PhnH [Alphaproteobacteria bacterium]
MKRRAAVAMLPGFADPVLDAQRVFRGLLEATSYPGRIVDVGGGTAAPAPLGPAAAAVCLALADYETPVWPDAAAGTEAVRDWLRFHCGCPLAPAPGTARFALLTEPTAMPALSAFDDGSDEYPDRSATLILQVTGLAAGGALRLAGPGIRTQSRLAVDGVPPRLWDEWRQNRVLFPRGVDLILACGDRLAALPRTVTVEI